MIVPMSKPHAAQIAGWVYPNEYAVYSFTPNGDTMDELLNGEYYACLDPRGSLTGYFCFGGSAQIPAVEADAYAAPTLDMGLGMKPDLCGKGRGTAFVQSGLAYAQTVFGARQIRLTVAAFNIRAIRTYETLGFAHTATITHRKTRQPFRVMIRDF